MSADASREAHPGALAPPEFSWHPGAVVGVDDVDALAVPFLVEDGAVVLGPGAADVGGHCPVDPVTVLERAQVTGRPGEVVTVPLAGDEGPGTVHLVAVGDQSPTALRRAAAALARTVQDRDAVATTLAAVGGEDVLDAVVSGLVLASFRCHWGGGEPPHRPVRRVVLAGPDGSHSAEALDRAVAASRAGWRARYLATVPANIKNPQWLAEQAEHLAGEVGLDGSVWDEHELAEQGCGGLLAVGRASATPPRLIRLDYTPPGRAGRKAPRVVLVGKGITFDSGGLSLKPGEAMATMKRDMTGGGVVLATMAALAAVGCPVRVTGLVPAAENAVDGDALRPGDVVTHYGGRTTEVTNTDAEGRLVMADALAYAQEQLDPAVLVDVATLTGAVKVALGQETGGLFATDDALAERLLGAGERSGERLWRMPLVEDYADKLSSRVADADNAPTGPGAVMAALFLRKFTGSVPWAHLDIASVGDASEDRHEWTEGPTGFGARLLLAWLGSPDPLDGVRRD